MKVNQRIKRRYYTPRRLAVIRMRAALVGFQKAMTESFIRSIHDAQELPKVIRAFAEAVRVSVLTPVIRAAIDQELRGLNPKFALLDELHNDIKEEKLC